MNDDRPSDLSVLRLADLADGFRQLAAEDPELVLAIVARLRETPADLADGEPAPDRDVPFMDFDE